MLSLKVKGNYNDTTKWLKRIKDQKYLDILDKYGKMGVDALRAYTPKDTGKTADSWSYEITLEDGKTNLYWTNSRITYQGHPVAILLQYGHGTGTGGYVQGIDYINPALRPIFDNIADEVYKEISSI